MVPERPFVKENSRDRTVPMPVLDAQGLSKSLGNRTLLRDVNLTVVRGEKVGVVGDNGSGKSTLGKILAGTLDADRGVINRRRGASFAYLAQEPVLEAGKTAVDIALSGLVEWQTAQDRYEVLCAELSGGAFSGEALAELLREQETVTAKIEHLGGWNRRDEAGRILRMLGISQLHQDVATMSGGERRRVALARLLISEPDLAILDEPTNHLDAENIEWLEQHLKNEFPGAVLLITHDRWLLSSVVSRTLEVEDGNVHAYDGGWEEFLEARAERRAQEERSEANRQNFLRKELEWLRRQPKARTGKQKARITRAEAALSQAPPGRAPELNVELAESRLGGNVLEARGVRVGFDGRVLVESLDFQLMRGDRVGIVGRSGAGKSTLLRTLLGDQPPLSGEILRGKNTRIAYLDQMRTGLSEGDSVFDAITSGRPSVKLGEEDISSYSYLKRFRFIGDAVRQKIGGLSGGERSRVALARLLLEPANVLVLDEPTNDLDVMTLSALEELIIGLSGAALIVSHDRYFLDRVATTILGLDAEGGAEQIPGGYSRFSEVKSERKKRARVEENPLSVKPAQESRPQGNKLASEAKKKLTYAEEKELAGLMSAIDVKSAQVTTLEKRMADPDLYVSRREEAAGLERELREAKEMLEEMEMRWLELEERRSD